MKILFKKEIKILKSKYGGEKGFSLLVATMIILAAGLTVITTFSLSVVDNAKIARNRADSLKIYWASESGIEDATHRIKNNMSYAANYALTVNGVQAAVDINSIGDLITVVSTGELQNKFRKTRVELNISKINPEFFYGAQVGAGGVEMSQSSRIEGAADTAGNIYSNGPIAGANAAVITGTIIVATGVAEDSQAVSNVCDENQEVGRADPYIDFAQSFIPSESEKLAKISIYIKKVGSPGDRTVRITNDNNGSPDDHSIANGTLYSSLVGTEYSWIDVTFSNPPDLISGNTYWIVLDAGRSASKYWIWCKDSGEGYSDGVGKYSEDWDDDDWNMITGDLDFKVYLGTGLSSVDYVDVWGDVKANTITNSRICGDAYYQTIDPSSLNFVNNPTGPACSSPLTPGTAFSGEPDPSVVNMPISRANIDQWKAEGEAGGTIFGNCGDSGDPQCVIGDNATLFLGPKKVDGNLVLTKKQSLVVTGTIYLTGSIDLDSSGGATIKCDDSYGGDSCVVVTDSWVHVQNNSVFQGSGDEGSYIMILSDLADCIGGVQQSQCTHHNGAIDIHNNAIGAIFYAADSLINLHNGVNISEVVAYKLRLDNNAVVTYEQGLANASFSAGPGASFNIQGWKEIE